MTDRWRNVFERIPEPPEPTAEQCSHGADVGGGCACWYPRMGGYAGKAVAALDEDCIMVWVWHDGQFPFSSLDDRGDGSPRSPVLLHHCDPAQFIRFGQFLEGMQNDEAG